MGKKVTTFQLLGDYFRDLMVRTDHHAQGVEQVALAVMGGIVWKSTDVEVMERSGQTKNVLWMKTNNLNYYFSYDHKKDEIVERQNNNKGIEPIRFNNKSSLADVHSFFANMP